tara:strand:- start:1896 stop:2660 length:765 start_codon:yes stop_codon:yes gene_type:complete
MKSYKKYRKIKTKQLKFRKKRQKKTKQLKFRKRKTRKLLKGGARDIELTTINPILSTSLPSISYKKMGIGRYLKTNKELIVKLNECENYVQLLENGIKKEGERETDRIRANAVAMEQAKKQNKDAESKLIATMASEAAARTAKRTAEENIRRAAVAAAQRKAENAKLDKEAATLLNEIDAEEEAAAKEAAAKEAASKEAASKEVAATKLQALMRGESARTASRKAKEKKLPMAIPVSGDDGDDVYPIVMAKRLD